MSLKDVEPGNYKAKPVAGYFGETKNGVPFVCIDFEFEANGVKESIHHNMFLSEKAAPYTADKLLLLGFNEFMATTENKLNDNFSSKAFANKEVELVLDHTEDSNDPSKKYLNVKYINELGGSKYSGKSAVEVLARVDLKAIMAAARAKAGKPVVAPKVNENEIPF